MIRFYFITRLGLSSLAHMHSGSLLICHNCLSHNRSTVDEGRRNWHAVVLLHLVHHLFRRRQGRIYLHLFIGDSLRRYICVTKAFSLKDEDHKKEKKKKKNAQSTSTSLFRMLFSRRHPVTTKEESRSSCSFRAKRRNFFCFGKKKKKIGWLATVRTPLPNAFQTTLSAINKN